MGAGGLSAPCEDRRTGMNEPAVRWEIDARGVAAVTFNRPRVNNAYDAALIEGVLEALDTLGQRSDLRAVVLRGAGRHFQAGADLTWLNAVAQSSLEDNIAASRATASAVHRLNTAPVPTLALVQGAC